MKRRLAALVVMIALCMAVCIATAYGEYLNITVNGNAPVDGVLTCNNQYYYRIDADTDMDSFPMGWSNDPNATEPDPEQSYISPIDRWYEGASGDEHFIITLPPDDQNACTDVMFFRKSEEDPWQKIVFNYDPTKTATTTKGVVTKNSTTAEPILFQDSYTVKWSALSGADMYWLHWSREGEDRSYTAMSNKIDLGDDRYKGRQGGPLEQVGVYDCWVEALKGGTVYTSTAAHKQFTVAPILEKAEYSMWGEADENGEIDCLLNQWVNFTAWAPGAWEVHTYAVEGEEPPQTEDDLNEDDRGDDAWPDNGNRGEAGFQWIEPGRTEDFSKWIIAEAIYYTGEEENFQQHSVLSNAIKVNVDIDEDMIVDEILFNVPDDVNTSNDGGNTWQVARDGRLFVDVNNYVPDGEGGTRKVNADYFGLYIDDPDDEGWQWLADSHWVAVSDDQTTRIPLTVPRCTVGETYEVRVFAIKYGVPQQDAEQGITIEITPASVDSEVIVSMGDSFITGEPLRVFAHYTNPDLDPSDEGEYRIPEKEGTMQIRIVDMDDPEHVVYDERKGFVDFWDDGSSIWDPGQYTVEAYIYHYDQMVGEYRDLKTITVEAPDGWTTAPQAEPMVQTVPAGQDLVLTLTAPETDNTVKPDWFDYTLFRADWDFAPVNEGSLAFDEENEEQATLTIPGE